MDEDRIEQAVARIETALARIAQVADAPPAPQRPDIALRAAVKAQIAQLDVLIEKLDP